MDIFINWHSVITHDLDTIDIQSILSSGILKSDDVNTIAVNQASGIKNHHLRLGIPHFSRFPNTRNLTVFYKLVIGINVFEQETLAFVIGGPAAEVGFVPGSVLTDAKVLVALRDLLGIDGRPVAMHGAKATARRLLDHE